MKHARAFQDHLGAGSRFVADRLVRARSAAGRADALPVGACCNEDAFPRSHHLRGPIDRSKGVLLSARIVVRGHWICPLHIVRPAELGRRLPGLEFRAVRQEHRRLQALKGLSGATSRDEQRGLKHHDPTKPGRYHAPMVSPMTLETKTVCGFETRLCCWPRAPATAATWTHRSGII